MTRPTTTIVITSINPPTEAIGALAEGSRKAGINLIVVGDTKSPSTYDAEGVRFLSIAEQRQAPGRLATILPTGHYARKNLGYLAAVRAGSEIIVDTDDDNLPRPAFFAPRQRLQSTAVIDASDWVNIYAYFTEGINVWPRGLPLDADRSSQVAIPGPSDGEIDCPIQQGLADIDPDVDAIFRLISPAPVHFQQRNPIALAAGSWCPFNSQNTTWFRDAFALLYLPSYCSIRMTDIWRGMIAQRIAWANRWHVLFHSATVWQERNEHNLMKDFDDEIPGYLNNREIASRLAALEMQPGVEHLGEALRKSYEELVSMGLVGEGELALIDAWLADLSAASH